MKHIAIFHNQLRQGKQTNENVYIVFCDSLLDSLERMAKVPQTKAQTELENAEMKKHGTQAVWVLRD